MNIVTIERNKDRLDVYGNKPNCYISKYQDEYLKQWCDSEWEAHRKAMVYFETRIVEDITTCLEE